MTTKQSAAIYEEMLEEGYDLNGDGQLSVEEVAAYYVDKQRKVPSLGKPATAPFTPSVDAVDIMPTVDFEPPPDSNATEAPASALQLPLASSSMVGDVSTRIYSMLSGDRDKAASSDAAYNA